MSEETYGDLLEVLDWAICSPYRNDNDRREAISESLLYVVQRMLLKLKTKEQP